MNYCLPEPIAEGRAEYLAFYRKLIDSTRQSHPEAVVELMLAIGDGSNPHHSRFNLPVRIDIVSGSISAPTLTAAELDEIPTFDPCSLSLPSGRTAELSPFPWHGCDILFTGPTQHWEPVLAWFDHWFDRAETHQPDHSGLSGVIHSISEPAASGLQSIVTVDFGSAPIQAFEDLLTVLDSMGLSSLRVGYFP